MIHHNHHNVHDVTRGSPEDLVFIFLLSIRPFPLSKNIDFEDYYCHAALQ